MDFLLALESQCFNPRAREGRDDSPEGHDYWCQVFQSTRPRGARLGPDADFAIFCESFNPRAREGRDPYNGITLADSKCFNPRAREGRDVSGQNSYRWSNIVSIHAPARGATVFEGARN